MTTADAIVACPRGRFFCWRVASRVADDRGFARDEAAMLAVLSRADTEAVRAVDEPLLLGDLAYATDFARYWQPPDDEDILLDTASVRDALVPVAEAILSTPATSWWSSGIALQGQVVFSEGEPEPTPRWAHRTDAGLDGWRRSVVENEERFRRFRLDDPDAEVSGEWWSTPLPSSAVETSRCVGGAGPLALLLEEDTSVDDFAWSWPVSVTGTPRILEITGPRDWAELVAAHPFAVPESRRTVWARTTGRHANWVLPDWQSVAREYDAVHLTMLGYLTTPGMAIDLPDGSGTTVLAGWAPDSTWWLDVTYLRVVDSPTLWTRHEDLWRTADPADPDPRQSG